MPGMSITIFRNFSFSSLNSRRTRKLFQCVYTRRAHNVSKEFISSVHPSMNWKITATYRTQVLYPTIPVNRQNPKLNSILYQVFVGFLKLQLDTLYFKRILLLRYILSKQWYMLNLIKRICCLSVLRPMAKRTHRGCNHTI